MKTTLTQLLVHLDGSSQAAQRLEAACRIGRAHGAAVTGLYAVTPSFVALPFAPEVGPGVAAALREIDDELRARARAAFDSVLAKPGMQAAWAEVGDDPIMAVFTQQALYADLLVLGQHDPASTPATGVPVDFAESVIVASGKPALILPYIGVPASIGDTMVLAWKPTREAARAVSAALPMLQRARRVHVLSWSGADEAVSGQRLDLESYLKLHGVEATWHREAGEPELLGELLLSRAFDLEADLLVMGCYGHSRAREWVLGGTSRTVLRSMTLPVLMAH
ncbi:MAG: universal stress protein [Polaromonas sp.]|uniref:universal stress protein n=1 Tax=Polaromonas sp. TaxID=1869339 RepID=UPI002730D995|nr:universal stress protein [Polaromonas sp.]MDP2452298.1 universal stress protein [Polaromonas sp.]MDP3245875.1 universal stress protein [Polaromonas sp.]MDP3755006.1 universal stress protein [Polaromonas sp.]